MTFAPQTLKDLGTYLTAHGAVNLGIVGDTAHASKGVSYHLGKDLLLTTAYSVQHPRDQNPTLAASAIDIGKVAGTLTGLQTLSRWLVVRCQAHDPATPDIREVIYSADGVKVNRWDAPTNTVYLGGTGTGQGDDSHLTHTHISYFRDSETRDKTAIFRHYFEGGDMPIPTAIVVQRWTANGTNGALRTAPDRSLVPSKIPAGTEIISYGEWLAPDGNNWRRAEWPAGSRTEVWFLRTGPNLAADHDFIAGEILAVPAPVVDCAAKELAAAQAEWDRIAIPVQQAIPARP